MSQLDGVIGDRSLEDRIIQTGKTWDLSKIDFDRLRQDFGKASYKNIEIADLKAFIERKLQQMLAQYIQRSDFAQKLQQKVVFVTDSLFSYLLPVGNSPLSRRI